MSTKGKLLGSTLITKSNAITLIKKVRLDLGIDSGDVIGFYSTPDNSIIITSSKITELPQELDLLGSSTLTSSYTVTLPKNVRKHFKVKKGDNLAYYRDSSKGIKLSL